MTTTQLKKKISKVKKDLDRNIQYFGTMVIVEKFYSLLWQIHKLETQIRKHKDGKKKEELKEKQFDLQHKLSKIEDKVGKKGKNAHEVIDKIETLLEKEIEMEERLQEKEKKKKKKSKKSKKINKTCISNSKTKLKTHQKKLIEVLSTSQRGIIAVHSTGSGKTLTAVTASQCFLKANKNGKIIVITPKSLQGNFIKEMQKYGADVDDKYKFYTFTEFKNIILNRKPIPRDDCMLIIDETHNIRTEAGKISKPIVDYAKDVKKVLLLTATPIINDPYDISNIIAMIDGTDPISRRDFKSMCENEEFSKEYFGCKISMFSPSEEDIDEFYPKSKEKDVYVPMSSSYEKKYNKLEDDIKGDEHVGYFGKKNLKVFYNGLRRGTNKLEENVYSSKIEWIMNKITSSVRNHKFVIYSSFLESGIKILTKELYNKKISFKSIDGSLTKEERKEIVEKYNANDFKVLLISKAGGEGLDLKETRHVILMEPNWNESGNKQVIGRAVRFLSHINLPKNERKVDIHRLFLVRRNEEKHVKKIMSNEKDDYDDRMISVDLYMKKFVSRKQKQIDDC
jgi:SNF2 family DNA or RNA helicase